MPRKLIAGLAAALIAMTGLAAVPARAQNNEQIGRAIAGALTLFVITKALTDDKKKATTKSKNSAAVATSRSNFYGNYNYNGNYNHNYSHPPASAPGKPWNGRWGEHPQKVVPAQCYFQINRGRSQVGVFGSTCLNEFMHKSDWLPRACLLTVPVRFGRPAQVYNANCLYREGYRMTRYEARDHR